MIRNNGFSQDSEDVRSDRLELMSQNIDSLAPVIGLSGTNLDWARNSSTNWAEVRATCSASLGQLDEAYQEYHKKFDVAVEKYSQNKRLLLAIIEDIEKNDKIINEYNIVGPVPHSRAGLSAAIDDWKRTHDRLRSIGDERVIPDHLVTEMVTLKNEYTALWSNAIRLKDISIKATSNKARTYDRDSDKLRLVYNYSIVSLGKDSSELRLLGFVPSSEIWTYDANGKKLPAPEAFVFDKISTVLKWSSVDFAEGYRIEHKEVDKKDWILLTVISKNEFRLRELYIGSHDYRVRAYSGESIGMPSDVVRTTFEALPDVANLRFDSMDMRLKWDEVAGATFYNLKCNGEPFGDVLYHPYEFLGGMEPGVYVFTCQAGSSSSTSKWSPTITVTF